MKSNVCPVPKHQIPIQEYIDLKKSIFFNWPIKSKFCFYRRILYSWLIILPFMLLISYGSTELPALPLKLFFVSLIWSLSLPFILLLRQLLTWNYIYKRLKSEKIEYEESGWYDGQVWEKTLEMREKDLLTAQHEIKPILSIIKEATYIFTASFCTGLIFIEIFPFNKF